MPFLHRLFSQIATALHMGYEYLAMLFGLGSLVLLCLAGLPLALALLCLPPSIRIPLGRRLISCTLSIYLWLLKVFCYVRIDDAALDSVYLDRPLIVIANHPSLLDAVILLSRLPHATCVMKESLRHHVLFGPMARLSGYISNKDPMLLIRQACDELQTGAHVLLFPEGTRTITPPVNPFSQTCAFISARSGSAVQCLFFEFSTPYLGKSWPIFRKPVLPLRITLRLGQKFESAKDRLDLTERLESYYREHLSIK